MKYKLAKQLKKAGFKQEDWEKWREDGHIPKYEGGGKDEVLIPTLSELIEACGDRFMGICREDNKWRACDAFNHDNSLDGVCSYGKTPKTAVAKLWLKLNL